MDRIYRIEYNGRPRYAVRRGTSLHLMEGDLFGQYQAGAEIATGGPPDYLPAYRMLAPLTPTKIVAIGLNYRAHAAEQNKPLPAQPLVFLKPPSAIVAPGDRICIPPHIGRVDHEAELAVVIGRRATRVTRAEALDYVLGITGLNDVTARDLQARGMQYSHVKGYDTFAPMGPCIAVGVDLSMPIGVEGWVNGQRRQASTTQELIFPVAQLIEYISAIMTLEPGDLIATGTPAGIGPLEPGDEVVVKVEHAGALRNVVVADGGQP